MQYTTPNPRSGAPPRQNSKRKTQNAAVMESTPSQPRLPRISQGQLLNLPSGAFEPHRNSPSSSTIPYSAGSLKSIGFNGQPTPPLTPPQHDNNPFGPPTMSAPSKMNALRFKSIFRQLSQRNLADEEDVSSLWSDILSTVTDRNSPSAHVLEEQSPASQHDVTSYMTYAVCTQADWLNNHSSINLILYNHHAAAASPASHSDYGTWKPIIAKMTSWLRERHRAYDNFVSQPTFGVITAGSKFIIVMLYSGSSRSYGEFAEDGNITVRDLTIKADQEVLRLLLEHVGSAEPARKEDTGFDLEVSWLPLEVGREEDATLLNTERRDSRSELQKPALSAVVRNNAAG